MKKHIVSFFLCILMLPSVSQSVNATARPTNCTEIPNALHPILIKNVHDGHLTLLDGLYWWKCGGGKKVAVNAALLTVHRVGNWNADNWAKGVVQGLGNDFLVHGRVGMFKTPQGVKIQSEFFDFDPRGDASKIREIEVKIGKLVIGGGKKFKVEFKNYPKVITDGSTYLQ